jgi:hypothetical protein
MSIRKTIRKLNAEKAALLADSSVPSDVSSSLLWEYNQKIAEKEEAYFMRRRLGLWTLAYVVVMIIVLFLFYVTPGIIGFLTQGNTTTNAIGNVSEVQMHTIPYDQQTDGRHGDTAASKDSINRIAYK